MNMPLTIDRPLGMRALVVGSLRLYGLLYGDLVPAAAIFFSAPLLCLALLQTIGLAMPGSDATLAVACLTLPGVIAAAIVFGMGHLVLADEVAAACMGEQLNLRQSCRRAWHCLASYIGACLLMGLALGGASLLGALMMAAAAQAGLTALGLVLLLIPVAYLIARWLPVMPALLVEDLGAAQALGRSWHLTRGRVWLCIGYLLAAGLAYLLFMLVLVSFSAGVGYILRSAPFLAGLIAALATATVWVVWAPLLVAGWVLAYLGLRGRSGRPEPGLLQVAGGHLWSRCYMHTSLSDETLERVTGLRELRRVRRARRRVCGTEVESTAAPVAASGTGP